MYELIERKEIVKYPSFTVYNDKVQTSDGIIQRQVVNRVDASAILPIFPNGDILLCKQYRHAIGKELLEVPAGKIDPGETPEQAGIRELKEETGYSGVTLNHLGSTYPSPGIVSEMIHIFSAHIDSTMEGSQNLDEGEDINLVRMPIDKVYNMILTGEIQDGKTIFAVMVFLANSRDWI